MISGNRLSSNRLLSWLRPIGPITWILLVAGSCVSIPQAAPDLSVELGKRISSLNKAHISLINAYFDQKRFAIDEFIQKEWLPEFATNFFTKPQIQKAWQEIVRSSNDQDRVDFLVMVGPQLQELLYEKKAELVAPLNEIEGEIISAVQSEYDLSLSINNTLTSFLVSSSKVAENQQRYLNMIKITDTRIADVIDQTDKALQNLVRQSDQVTAGIEKARELSSKADEYKKKLSEIRDKIKSK